MELPARFEEAQKKVNTLPAPPDTDTLLKLYALYKQGTTGDVSGSRPGVFDLKGRAKYDAWAGQKGRTREQAMSDYVALVDGLLANAGLSPVSR